MALSTCDTGNWTTLEKWVGQRSFTAHDQHKSPFNYEALGDPGQHQSERCSGVRQLRQPQKRLTSEQIADMFQRYQKGATINELGREFGVDRRTVAIRLKGAGLVMRRSIP